MVSMSPPFVGADASRFVLSPGWRELSVEVVIIWLETEDSGVGGLGWVDGSCRSDSLVGASLFANVGVLSVGG